MKIHLLSDLHMEFSLLEISNPGADVLVLSGDIIVAERFARSEASPYHAQAQTWLRWFEQTCAQYARVYYVPGNHEHYGGNFYETYMLLQNALGHIPNLVILDNGVDRYEGITFVGTTLWTDYDKDNFTALVVKDGLNDYRQITGRGYRKFAPVDAMFYHAEALRLIEHTCENWNKVVVLGHHAPSYRSISREYVTGRYAHLNPGYASHLDAFIEGHPQIALWTHGHVHSSHDYVIGATRIVANPRGYSKVQNGQENKDFDINLIVEV